MRMFKSHMHMHKPGSLVQRKGHHWHFPVGHSCQNCLISSKKTSSRLPPALPALCYCVTPLRERACIGTLRPSVHKRRGWMSLRRAQGSKHCVRSSGTPIRLCDPSIGEPLFLLQARLSFPPGNGTLMPGCRCRAQGWAVGDPLILKI